MILITRVILINYYINRQECTCLKIKLLHFYQDLFLLTFVNLFLSSILLFVLLAVPVSEQQSPVCYPCYNCFQAAFSCLFSLLYLFLGISVMFVILAVPVSEQQSPVCYPCCPFLSPASSGRETTEIPYASSNLNRERDNFVSVRMLKIFCSSFTTSFLAIKKSSKEQKALSALNVIN